MKELEEIQTEISDLFVKKDVIKQFYKENFGI
jgi:hypothetical protein